MLILLNTQSWAATSTGAAMQNAPKYRLCEGGGGLGPYPVCRGLAKQTCRFPSPWK